MKVLNPLIFICITIFSMSASSFADKLDISASKAHQLASKGDIILIDVRSVEEWEQTGLAVNSHPISMHQKGGLPKLKEDILSLLQGNKEQPIALICAGGLRSAQVQNFLKNQGFEKIYNVKEGIVGGWYSRGWIEQGLPTIDFMSAENF